MTRSESGPPGPRAGGSPGSIAGDLEPCWSCGAPVAQRALFCHACGAIQPPRALDPFARLGMERRFDLDPAQLARQHAGFGRALDPQRFAAKGLREQANAKAQADALHEAFETLRDPVRRAHALLALLGGASSASGEADPDDDVATLTDALSAAAADGTALDRLGLDIAGRIESCIKYLGPAFAKALADPEKPAPAKTGAAARILARLEGLEALAAEAAARRAILSAPRT
ncbi:molecular chaperone DnaJ [Azospirillum doebereinerae]|uniref:Molecular chaperone DnaJ n=1 Tax=Azospirillum doebereinerae TaxID=92933 RepID=A0A433JC95_9PROT|nr:molecular chaperone DnaJ [Azospirillum doebereinerae]RUQ74187.1 molecular chaperone DnaJ [Azospirillum doebereinerae]